MSNQGEREELEGEEGEKEERGKQKKIPEPLPRKNFGDWAEKQRKKKEADKARKKQEEAGKPKPPQQLKTPDQMVEEGLSEERALAIPDWSLPAEREDFALMSAEDEKQIVLEQLGRAPEDYL